MKELLSKLIKTKHEFHSLKLTKSGKNKFAGYEYFELSDFIKPLETIMSANGLFSVTSFDKEMATLTVYESETGQSLQVTSPMSTADLKGCHQVQNLGAVQTYLRRYLYQAMFDIVENDALEPTVQQPAQQKPQTAPKNTISDAQVKMLHTRISQSEYKKTQIQAYCINKFKKESSTELTTPELNLLLTAIDKKEI